MADNFNLRQYLVENKLGPFAKAKSINEDSRIEGLVNQDMLRKFLIAASNIVEDLEPEGFDEEDVIIYLEKQLDSLSLSMLRAKIPARKGTGSRSQFESSLYEYEVYVDDEGYGTDDEGTRKFVGKQYAGQTLPNWPSGKAEPFDAKASFIPRNAVQTHERPKKTADQEEKEKNEIDLITKELIDRGLFSPDTKVKSGEMVTSQTVGRLKHNEDIRNAISDIADKHDISYSVKNKYWHKFW